MLMTRHRQRILFGLTCMSVLAGCAPESTLGPPTMSSFREPEKTASREGTIEIKRTVAYRGRDAARGTFTIRGEVHFTVDPMENVKQEAYAVSLVLDATLAPAGAQFPPCLVYGAARSVITTSGKNPVSWDESFFVERDGGPMYLFLRFALDSGILTIQEMWIDCPSVTSVSAAY
jgi:hypothetical protein